MKKQILNVIIIIVVIIIIGCNIFTKKLVCTYSETALGIKIESEITINYLWGKSRNIKAINKSTLENEEDAKEYFDEYKDMLKSGFEENGYKTSIELKDNTVSVKGEAKISNLKDEDFKSLITKEYNETKKALEKENYKCK